MWMVLFFALGCDSTPSEAPAAAPVAAPAPAAAPAEAPAPAASGEVPSIQPVRTEAYDPELETFHGGYGGLVDVKASSVLAPQGANTYAAANMDDDRQDTAWVEAKEDAGVGEWFEFTYASPEPGWTCGEFHLANGYQKSKAAFQDNARVKAFDVVVGGQTKARLQLEDAMGVQSFELPVAQGDRVRLVIAEVYPGGKWADTAVTEAWVSCGP